MRRMTLQRFCNGAVMRWTALYSKMGNGRLVLWSTKSICYMHVKAYEPGGRGFESCRARQKIKELNQKIQLLFAFGA